MRGSGFFRGDPSQIDFRARHSCLYRRRFFLCFFLYLVLYHVTVVNRFSLWSLNDVTWLLYCVDFSYGFASKLLPGAVYNLLAGAHASRASATAFATVFVLAVFAGIALLLERFLLRMPPEHRGAALLLSVFCLSGAYTFAIYTRWVGMLDTWWLLTTLLFFVCLEHRRLRFLIPALFALALMIHFSAVVFFLTVYSILLLYRISVSEEKRERRGLWAVFAASLAVTACMFFFLILYEAKTLCSMEDFHEELSARGNDYYFYFDYAFFRVWSGESFIPDAVREMEPSLIKFLYLFRYQIGLCYGLLELDPVTGTVFTVGGTLVLLPAVLFFSGFHWRRLRQKGNGLRRFCAFLMLVQFPFVYVLGLLFAVSVDMTRYLSHAFLGMLVCLFAVLYYEAQQRDLFFERLRSLERSLPVKLYFLAYAAMALMPC